MPSGKSGTIETGSTTQKNVNGPHNNSGNRAQNILRRFVSVWQSKPMLWQLLTVSAAIQCVAAAIAGAIIVYDVKQEAVAEMANTLTTAEQVLMQEIDRAPRSIGAANPIEDIPFDFRMIRDVDMEIYTADRKLVKRHHSADESDNPDVPQWFVALVAPQNMRRNLPVEIGGRHIGSLVLIAQLPDDIEDVWDGFVELLLLTIAINFLIFFLLYLALSRIVRPLGMLVEGLRDLEHGHYDVRLPRPRVFELAAIIDRVNALSDHLRNARIENLSLSRRLISIQDDERRQIAAELHDELGPYLFGLSAEVSSLRQVADGAPVGDSYSVHNRIEKLLSFVHRIQDLNRQLLGKLRPMSIGRVSLAEALAGLLAELETFKGEATIAFNGTRLEGSYGETVDLTVYRCIREGVINAIRHAGSKNIKINILDDTGPEHGSRARSLIVTIEDDGRGISPNAPLGYGLTGIRERVRALGGEMKITPERPTGTKLEIRIPLDEQSSLSGRPF